MSLDPIQPGAQAPDFTLQDQTQKERSLSEFTGSGKPTVLFFYCLDWSPVCTPEMETFAENFERLEGKVNVVGICGDHLWSHKAFAEHVGIPFPLLADWGGDVSRSYGLWLEDGRIAKRATVYLDPSGTVQDVEVSEVGQGRDIDAIIRKAGGLS